LIEIGPGPNALRICDAVKPAHGPLERKLYYFTPKISVPLRVVPAEAKRANARK